MPLLQNSEMATVNNSSVDTVNAAATAIVTAEARAPPTAVQKRRWSSWWSMYWCFGNHKSRKRIGHAVLAPEPAVQGNAPSAAEIQLPSTAIILPFIAPPSSPASFLQSDPPSVVQSPTGLLSLTNPSFNAYSPRGPGSIFTVGPYAYETQLVSPPVFSTFPTEPSTAPFTPPPELVQLTRPSSPEVPFARMLMSSLEGAQFGEPNQKLGFSYYELQTHHKSYPATPGGQLISPGTRVSYSGTTSPFNGKNPIFDCRIGEAPKLIGFEQSSTWKWGSRVGSGTVTPPSRESYVPFENNTSRVAALPNWRKLEETVIDHRVSFELTGEDVARCLASKLVSSSSRFPPEIVQEDSIEGDRTDVSESGTKKCEDETSDKLQGEVEKESCYKTQPGSGKEFNFDKPSSVCTEWWTNEKVDDDTKETKSGGSWSFFPILHPEVG